MVFYKRYSWFPTVGAPITIFLKTQSVTMVRLSNLMMSKILDISKHVYSSDLFMYILVKAQGEECFLLCH